MKVIVAQGNPGNQYSRTRHNVGWVCLDRFAVEHEVTFSAKPKFFAEIAELTHGGEKVLLVKPTTFYNESGKSARAIMDFYKLSPKDILVIHDELALGFGKIRVRHKGSDAGNNGIKSLNTHIGQDYARIRIGILNELRSKLPDADFVLSSFSAEENAIIQQYVMPQTIVLLHRFIENNFVDESFSWQPALTPRESGEQTNSH